MCVVIQLYICIYNSTIIYVYCVILLLLLLLYVYIHIFNSVYFGSKFC